MPQPTESQLVAEAIAELKRRKAAKNRIVFVREFLKTFDPRPEAAPHHIDFDPYGFQEDFIEDIYRAIKEGHDEFIEKSRDMGASWCVLAVIFWCWIYEDGFQALLGSRKEDYVDDPDMKALFPKFDYFIEHCKDKSVLPNFKRTYMSLINLDNGNAIVGESSNPNFGRAGRFTVILYDELGFWPDAKRSWTAGGDATRCRIAITTPPDEPSYAKVLRFSGLVHVITLHWSLHPNKDQAWYEGEKKRRTPEEILHEIDISWEYSAGGRPYPEADALPWGEYPYDANLPLYVSLDVGLDRVAIGWWQPVRNSDWWTLVEAFEEEDRIIDWYYPFFGLPIDSSGKYVYTDEHLAMIEHVRYWKRGIFFGDPSGKSRHVESQESPYGKMKQVGLYVQSNERENDWKSRRDATRRLLPRLRLNDTPGVRWWHTCMTSAAFPKRAEQSQATTAIVLPIHNWTSHHRTMAEFFAVNYKNFPDLPSQQSGMVRKRVYDSTGRLIS